MADSNADEPILATRKDKLHPRAAGALAADAGILSHFGMTCDSALDGVCVMRAEVPAELINAAGFAHGGVLFSLADTACAYAVASTDTRGVTTQGGLNYVRAAVAGQMLEATATVVSRTRRTASLTCTVHSDGQLLAHGSFSFLLRDEERSQGHN